MIRSRKQYLLALRGDLTGRLGLVRPASKAADVLNDPMFQSALDMLDPNRPEQDNWLEVSFLAYRDALSRVEAAVVVYR